MRGYLSAHVPNRGFSGFKLVAIFTVLAVIAQSRAVLYASSNVLSTLHEHDEISFSFAAFNPEWSPQGDHILFETFIGSDIWIVDADGTNLFNLTENDDSTNRSPQWSNDGNRIAFISNRGGNDEIWLMDTNGSNVSNFSAQFEAGSIDQFRWSPDGNYIMSIPQHRDDFSFSIWFLEFGESSYINLGQNNLLTLELPNWSPDSEKVVFSALNTNSQSLELWTADLKSESLSPLISGPYYSPVWSPDGNYIAVLIENCSFGFDIGIIEVKTLEFQNLTNGKCPSSILPIMWSPNSQFIAYMSNGNDFDDVIVNGESGWDIGVLDIINLEMTNLTAIYGSYDIDPSWSPDSKKIVFASDRGPDNKQTIWVMNADGSNPTNLMDN